MYDLNNVRVGLKNCGISHTMVWEITQSRRVNMRRVLIADDVANMRWILERALSKAGYEVETVEDGQLALDRSNAKG